MSAGRTIVFPFYFFLSLPIESTTSALAFLPSLKKYPQVLILQLPLQRSMHQKHSEQQAHSARGQALVNKTNTYRGQATLEYLSILGVTIIIAMIVTGLVVQILSDESSTLPEKQSSERWKNASPWAIVDYSRNANIMQIILRNTTSETLLLMGVTLTPTDTNSFESSVSAGALVLRTFTITDPKYLCNEGDRYILTKENISIDYNASSLPQKTEYGISDIIGHC